MLDAQTFNPMHDRILVRIRKDPRESILWRPACVRGPFDMEALNFGEVVRVGPGRKTPTGRKPMWSKPGDVVTFGPYVDMHEGGYAVISQADVIANVE